MSTAQWASDLPAGPLYYKVGHHSSQKAPLHDKGLESMTNPDLSTFIPTDEGDTKTVKSGEMPYHGILGALERLCGDREVRADDGWLTGSNAPFRRPTGCVRGVRWGLQSQGLTNRDCVGSNSTLPTSGQEPNIR